MAVTYKKIPTLLILPAMAISMSGCSFVSKGLKAIDGKNADRIEKILNEKAGEYGISAEGVEVLQGEQRFDMRQGIIMNHLKSRTSVLLFKKTITHTI